MGLFESALISACIAAGGSENQQLACQKATEAGAKQSGISEQTKQYERRTVKKLEAAAEEDFGETGAKAIAGSVYLAKVISSKTLVIGLPTFGFCHSAKTELKPDTSIIKFEWKF